MTKEERYKELVCRVKECGVLNAKGECRKKPNEIKMCCNSSGKEPKLIPYEPCDEINLWSYWQGGVNHLNAKILLVGQDWGSMDTEKYEEARIVENIVQKKKTEPDKYLSYVEGNTNPTDRNLIKLFKTIGYDITEECADLFFTNLALCYREDSKISGGFKPIWASNCGEFFKELVDIIQPKVILCLGRGTYEGVMKALGGKAESGSYNEIIDEHTPSEAGGYKVFPLAHCGSMGTANRNKDKDKYEDKLHYQKEDWKAIQKYL